MRNRKVDQAGKVWEGRSNLKWSMTGKKCWGQWGLGELCGLAVEGAGEMAQDHEKLDLLAKSVNLTLHGLEL